MPRIVGPDPRPLRDAGLATVAMPYGKKFPPPPRWERWCRQWPTDDELDAQFGDGKKHNIAIPCGPASGGTDVLGEPLSAGLVVLVFNSRHLVEAWIRGFPLTSWTWCCETARGLHAYIRINDELPSRTVYFNAGEWLPSALEVRTDGAYVVGAGSLHPTGAFYTWYEPRPPEIVRIDFDQFGDWFRERRAKAGEYGFHLREGASAAGTRTPTSATVNPNVPRVLPDTIRGPQADSAGERHYVLVSLAGTLRRRGLQRDEIAACLIEVNARRCTPPCPEPDVRRIAASVARYDPERVPSDEVLARA